MRKGDAPARCYLRVLKIKTKKKVSEKCRKFILCVVQEKITAKTSEENIYAKNQNMPLKLSDLLNK